MANNTYWGHVPESIEIIEPGEFTDSFGTENEWPAIWLGDVLVEGSLESWKKLAENLTEQLARIGA